MWSAKKSAIWTGSLEVSNMYVIEKMTVILYKKPVNLDSHIAFSKFHEVLSEGAFGSILTFSKRKLRGYIELNPSSASMG